MTVCKEYFLDDTVAITAIPVDDIPGTSVSSPALQLTPTVAKFTPTLTRAVTIGIMSAATGVPLIPIVKKTGKAKDDPGDAVAGRSHTVTVTCQVDDREFATTQKLGGKDMNILDLLHYLELTPCHLMLTFRGGLQGFVAATHDSYHFDYSRDGAKTSATFKVHCPMGIQLMV